MLCSNALTTKICIKVCILKIENTISTFSQENFTLITAQQRRFQKLFEKENFFSSNIWAFRPSWGTSIDAILDINKAFRGYEQGWHIHPLSRAVLNFSGACMKS